MGDKILLVGSVPLETAEDVFRTFAPALGRGLASIPDGELGERRWWVQRFPRMLYSRHPDIETLQRPPEEDLKTERLTRRGRGTSWKFRIREGVRELRFADPGTGMGFTADAVASYAVFRRLRDEGVIPAGVRFQVSIPLPNSSAAPSVIEMQHVQRFRHAMKDGLRTEAAEIARRIPHEDLAIQWDGSWEITDLYGGVPEMDPAGAMARNIDQLHDLSKDIPETVTLGYHLCFGTFGGWPRFAPPDLGRAVEYVNAMIPATGRRVDWVHLPALDTVDDAFYAPLAGVRVGGARVYLGMIHSMGSFDARLAVARRHIRDFGLGAYCGFGRIPPADLPGIVRDHVRALEALGK